MKRVNALLLALCFVTIGLVTPEVDVNATPAELVAEYIINTYLYEEDPNDPTAPYLYVQATPLGSGDSITYGSILNKTTYGASPGEYVAWIDDFAGARFEHPSRIVITTVIDSIVNEEHLFNTEIPILLNNEPLWSDVSAPASSDLFFPDSTYLDMTDPDTTSGGSGGRIKFTNSENAAAITIYGNDEESNANNTKNEINDIYDKMEIPEDNRSERSYTKGSAPTGDALKEDVKEGINEAAESGDGPEFVIVLSAHGNAGGFALAMKHKKDAAGTFITWDEFLSIVCEALENTNKNRVLLIVDTCGAGGILAALANLNYDDCCDLEFGIAVACGANEYSYSSWSWGWPWDFIEELEDENWCEKDMMEEGEENQAEAAGDLEHSGKQHPEWGERTFTPTLITLLSFSATSRNEYVQISWTTATEINNAGFNIHRGLSKEVINTQLNKELIPAQGDELQGASYSFIDSSVTSGVTYYYWLEDIDLHGKSTMHGPVSAATTSVEEREEGPIPTVFSLAQNYPNPFNATTLIRYSLPAVGDQLSAVSLKIYNISGQSVRTLVDEEQAPGYYSVSWDGLDSLGKEVASGIYFYRIKAGDFTATRKMILLK